MPTGPSFLRMRVFDPSVLVAGAGETAHLIGPDDNPFRGEVRIDGSMVVASFVDEEVAALSLPVRAGKAGTLMLQTCILMPREEPYGLLVELARHRIKHFIQKCEEWQMWDPGLARGAMRLWDEARELFARALLAATPLEGERIAQRSLERSIEASEHLAMSHSEILLHRRFGHRAASSTTLGAIVRPSTPLAPALADALHRTVDVLQVPLNWREIEPKRGKPDFRATDRWISWALERKKPLMAGPLLDLRESCLPDHARVFRHDYESLRNLAYDHVERVVARYAGAVGIWNIGSGFHANEFLELSLDQMVDLARRMSVLVRQHNRKGHCLLEVVDPFGERSTRCPNSVLPWRFVEILQQEGITLSAVGLRLVTGITHAVARDLFQVSCALDRFLGRETRILLTGFGAPSATVDPAAGHWREGWTKESQASWGGRVASVALSRPFVDTIFWADASDAGGGPSSALGLFDATGSPKPILAKLVALRKSLRSPLGPRPEEGGNDESERGRARERAPRAGEGGT